jgi:hypothetical protein
MTDWVFVYVIRPLRQFCVWRYALSGGLDTYLPSFISEYLPNLQQALSTNYCCCYSLTNVTFRISKFIVPVVHREFVWVFLFPAFTKASVWICVCGILKYRLLFSVILMYKFLTLVSSVGTIVQVVPMVVARTSFESVIRLVEYNFFAIIKNRIVKD